MNLTPELLEGIRMLWQHQPTLSKTITIDKTSLYKNIPRIEIYTVIYTNSDANVCNGYDFYDNEINDIKPYISNLPYDLVLGKVRDQLRIKFDKLLVV